MREYLFHGKCKGIDKWVEGTGIFFDGINTWLFSHDSTRPVAYDMERFIVEPESVGQYTGMKDKHGRKIFEGDIVDCWSEGVNAQGTVQQRKDGLWIIYPAWQKHIMWGLCPDDYSNTTVEVIGNVFENADLLEG